MAASGSRLARATGSRTRARMPPRARAGVRRAASRRSVISRDVPIRAVIFDFNGTLSQDEPVLCRIYRELFAEYGKPISEREYYEPSPASRSTRSPSSASATATRAFPRSSGSESTATEPWSRTARPCPRQRATQCASPPVSARLAIVSGAAREEIVPVVAAAGLGELIATVVADDDVALGKPDPESYLLALESSASQRAETLVFEDTEAGVASAEGGGRACGRSARDAGTGAARRGRRESGDDRRPVAPAPARMTWTIAHRGASAELPENTPAAFERAIELGADFVEFDVHAAADGSLVVCHDPPVGGEPRLAEIVDQCSGRIGPDVRAQEPVALPASRRRRAHGRAAPGGRSGHQLRVAGAAPGAWVADAAARRPGRLDPPGGTLRVGAGFWDPRARPADSRWRGGSDSTAVYTVNDERRMRAL